MNEDLSSDVSDEDYVPEGADAVLPSEEESDGDPEDSDTETSKKRKVKVKRKKSDKSNKKIKLNEEEVEETKPDEPQLTEDEQKKKADSLWADFLKDTNTKPKPKPVVKKEETKKEEKPVKVEKKVNITKIFEFAGEEVRVTKEVRADSAEVKVSALSGRGRGREGSSRGGLSSILNQLGKKEKISTLEKSKLDWDRFKKDEKIEEELQAHNRGKDGYLERQDFLQRADMRQFEIEKEFRTRQRSQRL